MKRIAILPARGGSKRIPRKNIRPFCGKPMLAYAIEAAKQSMLFERILVSTDDPEIAELAVALGADVPFLRSAENSSDFATTVDVLLEVIGKLKQDGFHYDAMCCIYPTNPFLTAHKLETSCLRFEEGSFDALFSAVKYSFPVQRSFVLREGKMRMLFPEHALTRSQDLEPVYHDAAQFYWMHCEKLLEHKKIWTDNTGVFEIPETEVQDIDHPSDWELAELKFTLWKQKSQE
jgi:N-acylneuraminate cytidylyltransferase